MSQIRFRSMWSILPVAMLAAVAVLLAWNLLVAGLTQPVSFDGAMNLQVAASVADGTGYARYFGGWRPFPAEVQTNAPYVLPAAGVYALFGVTPVTSQVVSLLYLYGFLILSGLLLYRMAGVVAALAGCIALMLIPELGRFGLGGYGEIPALFWFMAALVTLAWNQSPDSTPGAQTCLTLGVCLALAVLTKTVMLMPVAVAMAVLLPWLVWHRRLMGALLVLIGFMVLICVHELWRAYVLGGWAGWRDWWSPQIRAVLSQAGVGDRFDDTGNILAKLHVHAGILGKSLGLPVWLIWIYGASLVLAAGVLLTRVRLPAGARVSVIILSLVFAAYACWWLGITPTEKAWYRRIIIGVAVSVMLSILFLAIFFKHRHYSGRIGYLTIIPAGILVMVLSPQARLETSLSPSRELSAITRASDYVQTFDEGVDLVGSGWYSAPSISLYSGRNFEKLKIERYFPDGQPDFLVTDYYFLNSDWAELILDRVDHTIVFDHEGLARIYRLDLSTPETFWPQMKHDGLGESFDLLSGQYSHLHGVYSPERDGWRWSKPLSAADLVYVPGGNFHVDLYIHDPSRYHRPDSSTEFSIRIDIDGCEPHTFHLKDGGRRRLEFRPECESGSAGPVRVIFRANAILEEVSRDLSFILFAAGFDAENEVGAP